MKTIFVSLCSVLLLAGCASTNSGASDHNLRAGSDLIPIPHIGNTLAEVVVPKGWHITETAPNGSCDYILEPLPNPDKVTIAVSAQTNNSTRKKRTEQEEARDYLEGIWDVNDDKVTVEKIGSVAGIEGPTGLYLYHSEYWRYRVASIFVSDRTYCMLEMYCPSEAVLRANRAAFEDAVKCFRINK